MIFKKRKNKKKARGLRLVFRRLVQFVLVLIAIPLILVPVYAFVPPISMLMIKDTLSGQDYRRNWVSLDRVSKVAVYSVFASEDARHCQHGGVDWVEMEKAWNNVKDGGRGRGASTITMQTVKNLFLWNSRSYIRKAIELPLALYADLIWSKRRTMEIYLNIAEWDKNVYGIDAAARTYFNTSAKRLNATQAARLAVALPSPVKRNPGNPTRTLRRKAATILARARQIGPYAACLGL